MNRMPGRRVHWAALGAIAGALVAGGVAWADIPDRGVIHGCYKTSGGALRVIDASAGAKCNASETLLYWDQTAPRPTTGTATVPDSGSKILFTLDNGVSVEGRCASDSEDMQLVLSPATPNHLQASGTFNTDSTVAFAEAPETRPVDDDGVSQDIEGGVEAVDLDVVARDSTMGNFAHIDAHGTRPLPPGAFSGPCSFWWMIIPPG